MLNISTRFSVVTLCADVYFDPATSMVWEVLAADLSLSPIYPAAIGRVSLTGGAKTLIL